MQPLEKTKQSAVFLHHTLPDGANSHVAQVKGRKIGEWRLRRHFLEAESFIVKVVGYDRRVILHRLQMVGRHVPQRNLYCVAGASGMGYFLLARFTFPLYHYRLCCSPDKTVGPLQFALQTRRPAKKQEGRNLPCKRPRRNSDTQLGSRHWPEPGST